MVQSITEVSIDEILVQEAERGILSEFPTGYIPRKSLNIHFFHEVNGKEKIYTALHEIPSLDQNKVVVIEAEGATKNEAKQKLGEKLVENYEFLHKMNNPFNKEQRIVYQYFNSVIGRVD